jgi:hypothetical protein
MAFKELESFALTVTVRTIPKDGKTASTFAKRLDVLIVAASSRNERMLPTSILTSLSKCDKASYARNMQLMKAKPESAKDLQKNLAPMLLLAGVGLHINEIEYE